EGGTDAAGLGIAVSGVTAHGKGADGLAAGVLLGARHHPQRGGGIGQGQAERARAILAQAVLVATLGFDDQVVEAEPLHQPQCLATAAFADRLHGDDGADAEDQAEQGEQGAQLSPRQFLQRFAPGNRQSGDHSAASAWAVARLRAGALAAARAASPAGADSLPSWLRSPRSGVSSTRSPTLRPSVTRERATPRSPSVTSRRTKPAPSATSTKCRPFSDSSARLGTVSASASSLVWISALKACPGTSP